MSARINHCGHSWSGSAWLGSQKGGLRNRSGTDIVPLKVVSVRINPIGCRYTLCSRAAPAWAFPRYNPQGRVTGAALLTTWH